MRLLRLLAPTFMLGISLLACDVLYNLPPSSVGEATGIFAELSRTRTCTIFGGSVSPGLAVDVGPVIDVFDRIMLDAERRVQYHFVLVDYLCRVVGGRLAAGTDAADVVIADTGQLAPFELTQKSLDVIARGMELAQDRG